MSPPLKLFGRAITAGKRSIHSQETRIDYTVERWAGGFRVTGRAKGRLGRVEVFRGPAPPEFLLNNWQSWGPLQKMRPGEGRKGIEDVMSRSSPYVFTPVPEVFRDRLVSDSFIAAAENGARIPIRRAVGDSFLLGCRASSG